VPVPAIIPLFERHPRVFQPLKTRPPCCPAVCRAFFSLCHLAHFSCQADRNIRTHTIRTTQGQEIEKPLQNPFN